MLLGAFCAHWTTVRNKVECARDVYGGDQQKPESFHLDSPSCKLE